MLRHEMVYGGMQIEMNSANVPNAVEIPPGICIFNEFTENLWMHIKGK